MPSNGEGLQPVVLAILDEVVLPVELYHCVGQLITDQLEQGLLGWAKTGAVPSDLPIALSLFHGVLGAW